MGVSIVAALGLLPEPEPLLLPDVFAPFVEPGLAPPAVLEAPEPVWPGTEPVSPPDETVAPGASAGTDVVGLLLEENARMAPSSKYAMA